MTGLEEMSRLVDEWLMDRPNRTLTFDSPTSVRIEFHVAGHRFKGEKHAGLQELKKQLMDLCTRAVGQAFLRAGGCGQD